MRTPKNTAFERICTTSQHRHHIPSEEQILIFLGLILIKDTGIWKNPPAEKSLQNTIFAIIGKAWFFSIWIWNHFANLQNGVFVGYVSKC